MRCKGCRHCKMIHFPYDYNKRYLHYCDSRKFYTDEDDTIGDSYKVCQGKYYEENNQKND